MAHLRQLRKLIDSIDASSQASELIVETMAALREALDLLEQEQTTTRDEIGYLRGEIERLERLIARG